MYIIEGDFLSMLLLFFPLTVDLFKFLFLELLSRLK